MRNSDMPAMPFEIVDEVSSRWWSGMTKREMVATHIAAGFAADGTTNTATIVNLAVEVADALLAELERTK